MLGSAVNPVLREGNSDRRAAVAVKEYAKKNPHSMGAWSKDSKSHVSTMDSGDFCSNEKSVTMNEATDARIEFVDKAANVTVLKESTPLLAGEVIDATVMSKKALCAFLAREIDDAKAKGVLFSLHMKATMMKVSDPVIFGHCVKVFYREALEKHAATIEELGVDFNNGIGDLYAKIEGLPDDKRAEIEADIQSCYASRPELAMVNSDKGITNLHVPSDVIIDASMPAAIRTSGQMWGPDGKLQDTKFVIPDHSYASLYQAAVDNCRANGAFDPSTMGTVPNVGLMAQKAEEYGSHDKDIPVSRRRHDPRGRFKRGYDPRARGRRGRYLARMSGKGRPDSGLGKARRYEGEGYRRAGHLLARQEQGARRPAYIQGGTLLERP